MSETNQSDKKELTRRTFLKTVLVGGSVMVAGGLDIRAQGSSVAPGDVLVHMKGDRQGEPLLLSELPAVDAFKDMPAMLLNPMNPETGEIKTAQIDTLVVARVDPAAIPDAMAAYATETGVVFYSAVCTHFACLVDRINDDGLISCACHGSVFDPAQAAEPLDGPAPFALSMLPVDQTEDETFVVAGEFNFPVESPS